ncbi:hypothetical protein [Melghirimyces profundicolus]|nr:hypothetical protein [Melghirimyces profundicolus]
MVLIFSWFTQVGIMVLVGGFLASRPDRGQEDSREGSWQAGRESCAPISGFLWYDGKAGANAEVLRNMERR